MVKQLAKLGLLIFFSIQVNAICAQTLGQNLQIQTRFHSYLGKPSWLLVIRDLDHNQTIPYLYDISKGENFWQIFTFGRNYLIVTSTMQFVSYQTRYNTYTSHEINNFCQLESHGRILRGTSMFITVTGNLTPDTNSYQCQVTKFQEAFPNFTVANPS